MPAKKYNRSAHVYNESQKGSFIPFCFQKIVDWYRFGKPDWSVQEELLSIQSIPKLFEYYSLFYIREILGQHIGSKSAPEPVNESISFVFNLRKGATLKLLYEPKYWMATHPMADLRGLVNSEGWTTYNGMVTHRSSSGDFLIDLPTL